MKKALTTLALFALTVSANAVPVTISFEDTANDQSLIASYEIVLLEYVEGSDKPSRIPITSVPANIRQVTIDVEPGVREVAVAAVTTQGLRSPDSESLKFLVPLPPVNVRLVIEVPIATE